MRVPNRPAAFPWAGGIAVLLAMLLAVLLLQGVSLASLQPWHLTRAAGLIAYILLWASAVVGLLQTNGWLKGLTGPLTALAIHEHLALWSIYTAVFHAVILLWDRYVRFDWLDLLVPFRTPYRSGMVALGIATLYVLVLTSLTTYLRLRLGARWWRAVHLASLVGLFLALAHGVLLGTDTVHPAVGFLYRISGLSAMLLVAVRLFKGVQSRRAN